MNVYEARKYLKDHSVIDFEPFAVLTGTETPELKTYCEAVDIESKALEDIESALKTCKTDAQVKKAIKATGWRITKDNSADFNGTLSVWIADDIRIYKKYPKNYVLQKWQKVKMYYSGAPMFSANPSYF